MIEIFLKNAWISCRNPLINVWANSEEIQVILPGISERNHVRFLKHFFEKFLNESQEDFKRALKDFLKKSITQSIQDFRKKGFGFSEALPTEDLRIPGRFFLRIHESLKEFMGKFVKKPSNYLEIFFKDLCGNFWRNTWNISFFF